MLFKGSKVEVLEQSGSLSKVRDDNDNEFSVKTTDLKPEKRPRKARVE